MSLLIIMIMGSYEIHCDARLSFEQIISEVPKSIAIELT